MAQVMLRHHTQVVGFQRLTMVSILDNLLEMSRLFTEAATSDPITGLLLALGTLLFVFSFGLVGYLTLGAVADLLIPTPARSWPPEAGR